jgi:hypothetical protein
MMSNSRSVRWFLPTVLVGALLMAAAMSTPAWGAGYGELLRFDGKGTNDEGSAFELQEETHAFGVNSEDGSIYVGDEKQELSEEFLIQKYSATGAFEGAALLQPNEVGKKELPEGIESVEDLEGIAVVPAEERIYALVTYKREVKDAIDPDKEVAGALYAFKTTPVKNTKGKLELVPASGTNEEGVLASISVLEADSETQGQALLNPSGIAYDPNKKEVVILGQVDEVRGPRRRIDTRRLTGGLRQRRGLLREWREGRNPRDPAGIHRGADHGVPLRRARRLRIRSVSTGLLRTAPRRSKRRGCPGDLPGSQQRQARVVRRGQ